MSEQADNISDADWKTILADIAMVYDGQTGQKIADEIRRLLKVKAVLLAADDLRMPAERLAEFDRITTELRGQANAGGDGGKQ